MYLIKSLKICKILKTAWYDLLTYLDYSSLNWLINHGFKSQFLSFTLRFVHNSGLKELSDLG